jgi:hypothetical protein
MKSLEGFASGPEFFSTAKRLTSIMGVFICCFVELVGT